MTILSFSLHNPDLFIGQAIEVIDQVVDVGVVVVR